MKKLLLLGLSLALSSSAFAFTETREINQSSFTATNDTTAWIQISSNAFPYFMANTSPNTDLRAIIVSSPSAGGTITLYDSQGSAVNKIGVVSLGTIQEAHFNVRLSSGLTYSTSANTSGVTILFHIN